MAIVDEGPAECVALLTRESAQRRPDLAIDTRRILRRCIDQLHPSPIVSAEFSVAQEIARLQYAFKSVAQVVRQ